MNSRLFANHLQSKMEESIQYLKTAVISILRLLTVDHSYPFFPSMSRNLCFLDLHRLGHSPQYKRLSLSFLNSNMSRMGHDIPNKVCIMHGLLLGGNSKF